VERKTLGQETRPHRGRRRSWVRLTFATFALALGAATLTMTSPVQALDNTNTGPLDPRGFPTYFTDDSGISLAVCEDGSANCLGATDADLADTTDGEGFYWMATATLPSTRGELAVEFALEGAFSAPGVPFVFERLRVRGDLTQAGTYTLQHPYGSTALPATGGNVNLTRDVPCVLSATSTCSGPIGNFLRSTSAPVGYLGGGEVATAVTGGRLRNDLVLRAPNGTVIGRTNQFAIVGKVAPGPSAALSASAVDFGNTAALRRRSVAIRNLGETALSFADIRVAGARTIRLDPTGCAATATLAPGATCRANLTYRPGTARSSTASLVIDDNTIAATHRVLVQARTAAVVSAPRSVRFTARRVGTDSRARRILVDNTGVVPMRVTGVSLTGGNAGSFERRAGVGPLCRRGARVRPGGTCAVYVAFTPRSFGLKTTNLAVRTNALTSPDQVRLTGRAR